MVFRMMRLAVASPWFSVGQEPVMSVMIPTGVVSRCEYRYFVHGTPVGFHFTPVMHRVTKAADTFRRQWVTATCAVTFDLAPPPHPLPEVRHGPSASPVDRSPGAVPRPVL